MREATTFAPDRGRGCAADFPHWRGAGAIDAAYPGRVLAFLRYSGLRIALLVAVGGLAYAVGMRGLLLLLVAFLGSGLLSVFVLRGSRDQLGSNVGGVFQRMNDRIDAATRAEDEVESESVERRRQAPSQTPE